MSWLSELLAPHQPPSFEDDLNLVIARWTDVSRKGREALTLKQIGEVLLNKAERILDERRI